ncbi:NAD(P)/FAD-dependent oxidoreductase [Salinibacterium sp. NSLL150]|uniref:NAD(P)/FAD-dependent oxidoreductase n=1 Tax=unclassified Salinibacterium TaxID=2632331 RepID=UPI0018CFA526|nr:MULTISPECIES: NAD(P)/FAD-dependent oxidoreductase [unclassified Salinibacterium]MBH0098586.1 NAD(P)/FAD-dependent oxidoreductase [Salinibacterium sp. NSLL35]MBH0101341.1 NAD(P)/FAD-dependent oxidoreductase [Salinibacterium sp. NSLL150]MBH0104100.1 NAD(P)/FAD-dependent oxidoreductase [Salinibacterium sp. NSLL16]MBH0106861.1 NAD(P)/FAD-dependent oxidoreductase [Salinibacterium sp. NSLL17]
MSEQFDWDVVIVGGGPAGLSAALNLARARRRTLVLDSNRPRNSATFHSHGFLSRDGISPLELRKMGREELEQYPNVSFERTIVEGIEPLVAADGADAASAPGAAPATVGAGFTVTYRGGAVTTRTVLIATGLREVLPKLPMLRAFYGTSIHSCMECDGYEYADKPIALIGHTDDLAERALLLSQWSRDLIVFTQGIGQVSDADEAMLAERGVRVDRREVADVAGDRDGLNGVVLADGETIPREAAFVRPDYETVLDFAAGLQLALDAEGLIVVDAAGRTSTAGAYAIGDATPPGPQQLIVAAGDGAEVAAVINRDLL